MSIKVVLCQNFKLLHVTHRIPIKNLFAYRSIILQNFELFYFSQYFILLFIRQIFNQGVSC